MSGCQSEASPDNAVLLLGGGGGGAEGLGALEGFDAPQIRIVNAET